jgi:hypothetical protein
VQLSRAKSPFFRVDAVDRIKINAVEPHVSRIPIGGCFFDDNALVGLPGFEFERAVAHQPLGASPRVATLGGGAVGGDRGDRHRQPDGVREEGEKIGRGMIEADPQGVCVRCRYSHLREISYCSLMKCFRALQDVQERGVVRGE